MRYQVKPWTFRHHANPRNPETLDEKGVMLIAKSKQFFIASEHVYAVANLIIDTHEEMNRNNGQTETR